MVVAERTYDLTISVFVFASARGPTHPKKMYGL
jgi:hypothetical protein